jgi:hypothetical protein
MVRTTTGKGAGEIHWRRPHGARAVAETRWFAQEAGRMPASAERPSFLELFVPLVALSLGSVVAIALVLAALFALLSLVI